MLPLQVEFRRSLNLRDVLSALRLVLLLLWRDQGELLSLRRWDGRASINELSTMPGGHAEFGVEPWRRLDLRGAGWARQHGALRQR